MFLSKKEKTVTFLKIEIDCKIFTFVLKILK